VKQFINPALNAPNAKTIAIDRRIVSEFAEPESLPCRLISVAPDRSEWNSDIEWFSPDDEAGFAVFQSAFERLCIPQQAAPFLDLEEQVRLYIGFLVVRRHCAQPYFHTDWRQLNNEAFTVLTPVTANADNFGLLYGKLSGEVGNYDYRQGEAIMFGDDFVHSTRPGHSKDPVILLCFQFGTDKMKHWPGIYPQLETQATQVQRPDGVIMRTGVPASRTVTRGLPRTP
jgi:hypothetical protein